jgi:hypothetical protein
VHRTETNSGRPLRKIIGPKNRPTKNQKFRKMILSKFLVHRSKILSDQKLKILENDFVRNFGPPTKNFGKWFHKKIGPLTKNWVNKNFIIFFGKTCVPKSLKVSTIMS